MPTLDATAWIKRSFHRREDILPAPLIARLGILTSHSIGQGDFAKACFEIFLVERFGLAQLAMEPLVKHLRQERTTVLGPLALTHDELAVVEV